MTTRDTQPKRLPRRRARLIAAAVSAAAVWVPNGSQAQELATGFEIEERPIQKVPTTFKFQSRISQAKMPVGSQTFTTLYVNLVRGNSDVLCSEQLNQVQVRDSVLNIEIGRGFNCPLDDIIATNNDLNFQICIQSKENCLKPIALSSVPYAIKATFSQQAQESHTADIAAQCHYAHRVTADTGLLSVNSQSQYGYGYYDFATPVAPNALSSLAMPTGVTNASGFLQWTPVNPNAASDLTVCSRTHNSTALAKLDVFNVQASTSYFSDAVYVGTQSMSGYLHVDGNAYTVGDVSAQNGTMRTNLSVGQDANVGRDLHVTGNQDATNGRYRANLEVDGAINISGTAGAGGLTAVGDIRGRNGIFSQDLSARHATLSGNVTANGGVVRGNSLVSNTSVTAVSVSASGHVSAATMGASGQISSGSLSTTNATVSGRLLAGNGSTTGFEVTSAGQVIFYDAPQFPNGVVFPAASHGHTWSDLTNVPSGLTALGGLACASGQVAKWGPSGWSCGSDSDTTYSAGPGLALNGGQFGLNNTGCANGQVLKFNSSNNTWACQNDNDNGITQANADGRYVSSTAVREYRIGPTRFAGGSGWAHASGHIQITGPNATLYASVDLPRNSAIKSIKCSARVCPGQPLTLAAYLSPLLLNGNGGWGYDPGVSIPETSVTQQASCGMMDGWTLTSVSGTVANGSATVFDGYGYNLSVTLKAGASAGTFHGCQLTYTTSTF